MKVSHHSEYKHIASNTVGATEDLIGVLWEKDIDIPPPEDKSCLGKSQIQSNYKVWGEIYLKLTVMHIKS
eukprot:3357552-Ditylum_brightwellii.AAC.1